MSATSYRLNHVRSNSSTLQRSAYSSRIIGRHNFSFFTDNSLITLLAEFTESTPVANSYCKRPSPVTAQICISQFHRFRNSAVQSEVAGSEDVMPLDLGGATPIMLFGLSGDGMAQRLTLPREHAAHIASETCFVTGRLVMREDRST